MSTRAGRFGVQAILWVAVGMMLLPLSWLVLTAVRDPGYVTAGLEDFDELTTWTLDNFTAVLTDSRFRGYVVNSTIVALITTAVTVVCACLAGYSIARIRVPGRRAIEGLFLAAYVVPPILLLIPVLEVVLALGLFNTQVGVAAAHIHFALPFGVWMMRGYFSQLPPELEQAAEVDGASAAQTFLRIMLPLAAPGIVAVAIFAFILSWNEYLYALVLTITEDQRTLPVGVSSSFISPNMRPDDWANLMAAAALSAVPVVIVFVYLQRWFVAGLSAGSVKG